MMEDPQDIIDWIAEEIRDCEWVTGIDFDDCDAKCYVECDNGEKFVISVDYDKGSVSANE